MIDMLWNTLIGSILIVAILFAWIVIYSFFTAALKQWKRDRHDHH